MTPGKKCWRGTIIRTLWRTWTRPIFPTRARAEATRTSGGYAHELTDADHERLVRAIMEYPGMVMLSGYAHKLYEPLEAAGWDRMDFETACMAAGRTRGTGIIGAGAAKKMQPRTETVWRNPAALEAWKRASDERFKVREPRARYRTKHNINEG